MASYTKQMIDLAKMWLDVNPDPDSPFLNVPRITLNQGLAGGRASPTIATTEKYLRDHPEARNDPALMSALTALTAKVLEYDQGANELKQMEDEIQGALNTLPKSGHSKYTHDVPYRAYLARWCLSWARHGYNTIELSPDFAAAMLLTDPRELDIASVRMPFQGILFLIPSGFAQGREGGHYTKVHVTEVPSQQAAELAVSDAIREQLAPLSQEEREAVLRASQKHAAEVEETGGPDSPVTIRLNSRAMLDRAVYQKITDKPEPRRTDPRSSILHIHATDGVRALDTTIDRDSLTWDAFDEISSDVDFTADIEAMRAVRQIVFGALAYATAIQTATTPVPTEKQRAPRKSTEPVAKRWEIGRTIKIDHQLVRSVRGGSREVLYRLKHRHIVRGHYRNQAHGPQHSLRTMKWITPYWKGPEDGAALVHTYKLDEPT